LGSLLALLRGLQGLDQPLANPTNWISHNFTSLCKPSCMANRWERCCGGVKCISGFGRLFELPEFSKCTKRSGPRRAPPRSP
jgi:hypothetical protein